MQHDHSLLKERVARLGGPKATARLEAGLAAARAAALAQSSTTPSTSPNSSPDKASSSSGAVSGSPVAGGPGEGDENEGMAWELLYNLQWQLPTAELEAGWKDATGETSVMKVRKRNKQQNSKVTCTHIHTPSPACALTMSINGYPCHDCHHSPACCLKWNADRRCALMPEPWKAC